MKLQVHRRLAEIAAAQDKGYGKLAQKFLAIAFLEAGATRATERGVQGIDLEITLDDRRLALEVKTSEPGAPGDVKLGAKDIQGLVAREEEGFETYVAVLGNRLLDDWVLARHAEGEIVPNATFSPTRLRPFRDRALEARIAGPFAEAVIRHARRAVESGQGAIDEILRGYGAYRLP